MNDRQGLTVFVSSSISEFENLRVRLGKEIDDVGFLSSIVLETKGARPRPVLEEPLNQARACDVFLAIFGEKHSEITAREYEEARKLNKPCFVYVMEVRTRDLALAQFIDEKVQPFLKYQLFGSTDELVEAVRSDLTAFMGEVIRLGISSWTAVYPGNKIPEPPPAQEERVESKPVSTVLASAVRTLEEYLGRKDEKLEEFTLARTGPQWVRILAVLSQAPGGLSNYKLDRTTGIYGSIRWLRLRELQDKGYVIEIYDGKKRRYNITEFGAEALNAWLQRAAEGLPRKRS